MDSQMLDTAHGQIHVLTCGPSDGEAMTPWLTDIKKNRSRVADQSELQFGVLGLHTITVFQHI